MKSTSTTQRSFDVAGLLSFDAGQLEVLVDKYGIRQAWLNILGTRVRRKSELSYVLDDELFAEFEALDVDLLEGLSIGEIGVLYEYCVALVDADSRRDNGQFFTPDDVAAYMVREALCFPAGRWLDPCCGIGNLAWHLVNGHEDKEEFLIHSVVLSDKDELALLIARVLFTIDFQDQRASLFYDIEDNFVVFDFLSVSDNGGDLFGAPALAAIPQHDFVIVNPPYLATKREDERFETAKSRDLYAYFLENVIKTSKGFVSITPQSFTNASKFSDLRRLLLQHFSNMTIFNFDNIPGNVFYGVKFGSKNSNKANSIRAAITVAKQCDGESSRRITSLIRWRTAERQEMFDVIEHFLSESELTAEFFPKVSSVFEPLYSSLRSASRLGSLISQKPTGHVLYVPSAPRYFISALKSPVSRVSQRTLFFRNEQDLDTAYMALNSSLMYWWWRVRDGGMTLSLETIRSMPMPEFNVDPRLVRELEESEKLNRVFKRNAGANQENVKHPTKLLGDLNSVVVPEFQHELLATHQNTELVQLKFIGRS